MHNTVVGTCETDHVLCEVGVYNADMIDFILIRIRYDLRLKKVQH